MVFSRHPANGAQISAFQFSAKDTPFFYVHLPDAINIILTGEIWQAGKLRNILGLYTTGLSHNFCLGN